MPRLSAVSFLLLMLSLAGLSSPALAQPVISAANPWPARAAPTGQVDGVAEEQVTLSSLDPFSLADVADAPARDVTVRVYMPASASPETPVPGVVLVHGSGGVIEARERTYARELATMGVAALVVDAFGNRRDLGTGFVERVLNVTESMLLADAFAGLRHFHERPDVDGERVAIVGFSYGAMVSTVAAFAQVAETYAPDGLRFAGHAAYYGPCIVRFRDRRATGAPILMLYGTEDALVVREDCEAVLDDLRDGGARTRLVAFEGAAHQWDGAFRGPRSIGRNLAGCSFNVERDGTVRDANTWVPMSNPFTRRLILGLCTDEEGYLIGRDDAVRERSNAELGRFLVQVFGTSADDADTPRG